MKFHVAKPGRKIIYNTLCGRWVNGLTTVPDLKKLVTYPWNDRCKKCQKVTLNGGKCERREPR